MIDRTKAPLSKNKIDFGLSNNFTIPKIKLFHSANGSEIYFIKKDKLPIVYFTVLFFSGSKYDPTEQKGLAFLTSLLIDEGAGEYDALQLNNEIEKLGTVLNIGVNHDTFSFSILSLKENFIRSFELLSKILNEPKFEEKDFTREKKKVLDKILQLKDEPSYIANTAFYKQIFGENYYAFPEIGYEKFIQNILNDDVKKFYDKYLRNTKRKYIVVGNISEEEILKLIDKHFASQTNDIDEVLFELPIRSKTKFYFIHKVDSAQGEIRIGHIAKTKNSSDYYATKIMNTILGGQFSSRINLNLRERKGFTYGAHSFFNYFKKAGYFEVATAVNIQNVGDAVSEILFELNNIRENITKEEIDFAKSYLIKRFPSNFETYTQLVQNIFSIILHSLPIDYYEHYIPNIDSTTNEEIIKAAKQNIFPNELVVLTVGDKNKLLPQFMNLAEEVIELDIYGNRFK